MMATDLVNLGVPPLLASRLASGGTGGLTITAAGSGYSTGTKIGGAQFLCSCSNADGTVGLSLPAIGGNGALLADAYVINNTGTTSLQVFASSGVVISVGGANTSLAAIQLHTSMTLYPISSTQWIGVKGS